MPRLPPSSVATLSTILDSITDPFLLVDSEWRLTFVNAAAAEKLGRNPEALVGEPLWDQFPDIMHLPLYREAVRAMEEQAAIEIVEHFAPLDLSLEIHAYPLEGGLAVYLRDVSERLRAEQQSSRLAQHAALRSEVSAALSAKGKLQPLLQACAAAIVTRLDAAFARIWLLDRSGTTLELKASAGMYTHLDGPHARVPVGSFKIGLIAAEGKAHISNDVAGDPRVGDPQWARREGMVSFAGYPLRVEERVIGVMAMFARQPLAEDTLDALGSIADVLAQGVQRRRAEATLAEYARDLARSNADLEQFAYVASHDLQEPLRMVSSFTQLLARRYQAQLGAEADEYIGYVVDGATRMQQLINDLLTYSRVGTRGRELQPVEAQAALTRALANLGAALAESNAEVTHDTLPTVLGDEGQLSQLFQNLVGNALKFRSEEKPQVHIGATRQGSEWHFTVRDNGIGIEPQYFERIFVIFQRLHGRTEFPGTGIGLALCKRIVERHGGRIWLTSEPGRGSAFHFTLSAEGASPREEDA